MQNQVVSFPDLRECEVAIIAFSDFVSKNSSKFTGYLLLRLLQIFRPSNTGYRLSHDQGIINSCLTESESFLKIIKYIRENWTCANYDARYCNSLRNYMPLIYEFNSIKDRALRITEFENAVSAAYSTGYEIDKCELELSELKNSLDKNPVTVRKIITNSSGSSAINFEMDIKSDLELAISDCLDTIGELKSKLKTQLSTVDDLRADLIRRNEYDLHFHSDVSGKFMSSN